MMGTTSGVGTFSPPEDLNSPDAQFVFAHI